MNNDVTKIEFPKRLAQPITNLGSSDIQVWYRSYLLNSSKKASPLALQAGRWITIQGQRELWLPPDYQAISSSAKDGTIALGCTSGRVCIIIFSV
jgi:hypothetical protein